jgi:hypothetical protein
VAPTPAGCAAAAADGAAGAGPTGALAQAPRHKAAAAAASTARRPGNTGDELGTLDSLSIYGLGRQSRGFCAAVAGRAGRRPTDWPAARQNPCSTRQNATQQPEANARAGAAWRDARSLKLRRPSDPQPAMRTTPSLESDAAAMQACARARLMKPGQTGSDLCHRNSAGRAPTHPVGGVRVSDRPTGAPRITVSRVGPLRDETP